MDKTSLDYLPWIAVAALTYMLWAKPIEKPSDPKPSQTSIETVTRNVLPSLAKAYKQSFAEAATMVESGKVTTAEQLFDALQAGRRQRDIEFQKFQDMLARELPDGEITDPKDTASKLSRIAKSWTK